MTIQVGDHLPQVTFRVSGADGPRPRPPTTCSRAAASSSSACRAPTPRAATATTCRASLEKQAEIKARGVDAVAVTSVNDVFVLDAWSKASGAEGIEFLADGNGEFAKAIGLDMDGTGFGLGPRSKRYAMLVEDGVVRVLNVEDFPAKTEVSGADALLKVI